MKGSTVLRIMLSIWLTTSLVSLSAQAEEYRGRVFSPSGDPVFAANVSWLHHPDIGTITNPGGEFSLPPSQDSDEDSIVVKFAGYLPQTIAPTAFQTGSPLDIHLSRPDLTLEEITLLARTSVSEQFSVRRLEPMDIYLDPFAAADPLRAITALPASTNADESANPVLRGSASDLTQVIMNGVPIYQPVRNGQLNGIGNFSLFNTALLERQDVYASNPPLTYGNAAAGLVDIQTRRTNPGRSLSISASMASVGAFASQPLSEEGFLQVYGNWQFSDLFIGLNQSSLSFLREFGSKDLGAHLYLPMGKRWSFQLVSYGIDEHYAADTEIYGYAATASGQKRRTFHVASVKRQGKKDNLSFHTGQDLSTAGYGLGVLNANRDRYLSYYSVKYQRFETRNLSWETGISADHWRENIQDQVPQYYFAFDSAAPSREINEVVSRLLLEAHGYAKWDPSSDVHLAMGVRGGVPPQHGKPYLSLQASGRYDVSSRQSVLVSAGQYHSFLPPAGQVLDFSRIQSRQLSIDYQIRTRSTRLDLAIFHKVEEGLQQNGVVFVNHIGISGIELAWEQELGNYLEVSLANTWLRQRIQFSEAGESYRGRQDFPYFLKAAVAFHHPGLVDANITLITRPGQVITPITGGIFEQELNRYRPVFPETIHGERLSSYQNLSASISRYIPFQSGDLILFLNANNLLNRENPSARWYNETFDSYTVDLFSRRTIYAGLVWSWAP